MMPNSQSSFALVLVLAASVLLSACSFSRGGGGYYQDDGPDRNAPDVSKIPDAVPKAEPLARTGNNPYQALGKNYAPLADARDYRERGVASWYGKKFHGKRTSSGESYDMYSMTAAHRTLPLPTYVRVRNLENGRSVVVRVNDRGPFLHNRVIDLSYAAASKLGIVGSGTGLVEVESIMPGEAPASQVVKTKGIEIIPTAQAAPIENTDAPPAGTGAPSTAATATALVPTIATASKPKLFIQVGAFRELGNAEALRVRLENAAFHSVAIQSTSGNQLLLYRVRIGPLANVEEGDRLTEQLTLHGVPEALLVVD